MKLLVGTAVLFLVMVHIGYFLLHTQTLWGGGLIVGLLTAAFAAFVVSQLLIARSQDREALIRSILDAAPDAIISIDRSGLITEFNSMAEAMFQLPKEAALGRTVAPLIIPPSLREAHDQALDAYLRTGTPTAMQVPHELFAMRRDGSEFPIRLFLVEIPGHNKAIVTAFIQDMSRQVAAEREIREAERRFRRMVEHIPASAYVELNDAGAPLGTRDVYVSPQIEEMMGYPRERWLSDPEFWLSVVHPDDRERAQAASDEATRTGSQYQVEYRFIHRDGRIRWMRDIAWQIVDEQGDDSGWQGLMFDITDEHEAQVQRNARAAADQANIAKSAFLSRLSHELRTPLNAVLGFAQLMELDELTPDQQESVQQILRGGGHLLDLINEVLDIGRIEAGEMTFQIAPVDATDIARMAIDLVEPLARDRRITVTLHASEPLWVAADRQRLRQVLLNLLSNAVKYNRRGGTVNVMIRATIGRVAFVVSDTGQGFDTRGASDVFAPFERLDAGSSGTEGTGLGLALARGFAESMGGTLAVESAVGEGSTFTLSLPATDAPDAP